MKKCRTCGTEKCESEFYLDRTKKRTQNECKECMKIRSKKRSSRYRTDARYRQVVLDRICKFNATARGRLNKAVCAARQRAKKHGWSVSGLDKAFIDLMYEKQDGKCALTGISFDSVYRRGFGMMNPYAVSVDRIDSTKGYEKDNVRLVIAAVNVALNNFGEEMLVSIAEKIVARRPKNTEVASNGCI